MPFPNAEWKNFPAITRSRISLRDDDRQLLDPSGRMFEQVVCSIDQAARCGFGCAKCDRHGLMRGGADGVMREGGISTAGRDGDVERRRCVRLTVTVYGLIRWSGTACRTNEVPIVAVLCTRVKRPLHAGARFTRMRWCAGQCGKPSFFGHWMGVGDDRRWPSVKWARF